MRLLGYAAYISAIAWTKYSLDPTDTIVRECGRADSHGLDDEQPIQIAALMKYSMPAGGREVS